MSIANLANSIEGHFQYIWWLFLFLSTEKDINVFAKKKKKHCWLWYSIFLLKIALVLIFFHLQVVKNEQQLNPRTSLFGRNLLEWFLACVLEQIFSCLYRRSFFVIGRLKLSQEWISLLGLGRLLRLLLGYPFFFFFF